MVSAWATGNQLVLGQNKVDEKSNEIIAIPELLKLLNLSGSIVTIDVMGCQKKIAKAIRKADADYVLAVKDKIWLGSCYVRTKQDLTQMCNVIRLEPTLASVNISTVSLLLWTAC